MRIITETELKNFRFWSGAVATADELTHDDFVRIEWLLDELYPDGIDETALNDFFWFEDDYIAEYLGYNDFESLCEARKEV